MSSQKIKSSTDHQELYWSLLVETRCDVERMELIQKTSERWEFWLDFFSLVMSTGSIPVFITTGGWLQIAFGALVILAQMTASVRHILPWKKRIKAASELKLSLRVILSDIEEKWPHVKEGYIPKEDAYREIAGFRRRRIEAEQICVGSLSLPNGAKLRAEARECAILYIRNIYREEG